jgi:hypothetical protein
MQFASGAVAARGQVCGVEIVAVGGSVSATIAPERLSVELRAGSCSSPGPSLGTSSTGGVVAVVPAGLYHVDVRNLSDVEAHYVLTVQYTTPSI